MDAEQTIAEIELLERIFAVPDIRPLSASDLSLRIVGTMKRSRIARGFGSGNTMASVAELNLRYSDCPKSRPKLPQEFRTRIGYSYLRIELECSSEEIKMDNTISTKDLKSK